MPARLLERCGVCDASELETVLSLGTSPPTCQMVPVGSKVEQERHPLELVRCGGCDLVQLSTVVEPELVFPQDYPYSSGNSKALHRDFEDLADEADAWVDGLTADDLVVDIGANDGTLLSKFEDCRTVGVEPTDQSWKIDGPVFQEFFGERVAAEIRKRHGPAKVVTATNVLAHVEDVGDVLRGVKTLIEPDGVLVAENHDLASVVKGQQWDTVYHEHLRFYDRRSFWNLLKRHGLAGRDWHRVDTHGGSFRMFADTSKPYVWPIAEEHDFGNLARQAERTRTNLRKLVGSLGPMVGIGATARATTIINFCELDVQELAYVAEVPDSDKIGRYVPGTRIPVVDERRLFAEQPDMAILFSWHLADVIVPKLRERGYDGTIVLPLPNVCYL